MNKRSKYTINDRKGFINQLQIAVLSIAAMIVLSLFLYTVYVGYKEKMSIQSCKASISAHSLVATNSRGGIFTDIKCPTSEITIKDLKKTNEIIAEDMHRCWYIWNQGKGQYFKGDGIFCHICSVYQFGDKKKEVTGLIRYLATNDVKVTYAGEVPGIKYIDYFQGYSTPNTKRIADNVPKEISNLDTINTSEKYATIFVYASGKDAITKMLESGKRTTAITGLATFGIAGSAGSIGAAGMAAASGTAGTAGALAGVETVSMATPGGYLMTEQVVQHGSIYLLAGSKTAAELAAAGELTTVAGSGTAAAGGAVLSITPIGWAAITIGVVALTGYGIYTLIDVPDPEWMAQITFRQYNVDELRALGCEKLEVNQMSNAGTP